jgi:hypothetical protein
VLSTAPTVIIAQADAHGGDSAIAAAPVNFVAGVADEVHVAADARPYQ